MDQNQTEPKPCAGSPESTGYVASWPERLEEEWRYGLLLGALQGVSWQVEPGLRKRIEKILKEVEPHTNGGEQRGPRS